MKKPAVVTTDGVLVIDQLDNKPLTLEFARMDCAGRNFKADELVIVTRYQVVE